MKTQIDMDLNIDSPSEDDYNGSDETLADTQAALVETQLETQPAEGNRAGTDSLLEAAQGETPLEKAWGNSIRNCPA